MRGKTKTRSKSKKKPEDFQNGLETPIQYCPGVGPKRAFLFSKLNIYTIADLFVHFPRAYEDYHTLTCIKELKPGHIATLIGTVTHVDSRLPKSRSKVRHIINAVVDDATGSLTVVWFNQPYLMDKVKQGARLLLHGKAEYYDGYLQMSAPKIQEADENAQTGIAPLYPLTDGLTQPILRKVMRGAIERYSHFLDETLPEAIRDQYAFPSRQEAFRILHLPNPGEGAPIETIVNQANFIMPDGEENMESHAFLPTGDLSTTWGRARQRLVFEEFFMHQLVLQAHSGRVKKQNGIQHPQPLPSPWQKPIPCELSQKSAWPALFIWHLPFPLTKDQQTVCQEFEREMAEPTPMNRLLQGDVGSGKTVVSIYAMIVAVAGGRQAALMAPTEILARQHADTIRKWTDFLPGLTILVLSGNMKAAERKHAMQSIADGSADIVVGTHALFQDKVHFANLGLVVVDEQHKFGVNQRQKLVEKGLHPDLLVATATPIPRTLSLTLFGDMDVSTIKTMPPGRPEIITRHTQWEKEDKVWPYIDGLIEKGQQVYVVCPIIEPSENAPHLPSTEEAFEKLTESFLSHRRVAILHGKFAQEQKDAMMQSMKQGEIDAVVATTVIEVGVDLPNATAMVVLGADRFGLAQLHQLRGRVGRGTEKSLCVLLTPNKISQFAQARMQSMEKTRDGFLLAEEDLKLRGPGEYFGTRQSGHVSFRIGDPFVDTQTLHEAHRAAKALFQSADEAKSPELQSLKREIYKLYGNFHERRPS